MERLAMALSERGCRAEVVAGYSPEEWRRLMSSGALGRLRARSRAILGFPVIASLDAFRGGNKTIVATTNPFFLPFVLILSKAIHGRTVIALLYDLYPEALEASGTRRFPGIAASVCGWLNRFVLSNADGVVFIGKQMAAHIRGRYSDPRKQMVAETGAMLREHEGVSPGGRAEAGWLLSYVGNLGRVHDWHTVAEALPKIVSENVKLVCAASGPGVELWKKVSRNLSGESVEFVGPLGDQAWCELLAKTDVSLVTLRSEAVFTSIPSKLFSAMAAGCAIVAVAPRGSDLAEVITRHRCGRVVAPGDALGLVTALDDLFRDPQELKRCQAVARDAVASHYDISRLAERWEGFLEEARQTRLPGSGYRSVSRLLDLLVAPAMLALTLPLFVVIGLSIFISLGLPVLFSQERPGLHGKPFKLVKFRTMRHRRKGEEGAEADEQRTSRLGRFLRATSLDELPTFWNVLKGEMSLVGPRPLLLEYLDRYSSRQARRHDVKPGITGWAQVNGRNAITWEEKFEFDVTYVENQGLWFDLKILVKTVLKVFGREDTSSPVHATMPEFMGSEGEAGETGDE